MYTLNKPFIIFIAAIALFFISCGRESGGELVGVYNKKFVNNKIPLGMVYVPAGTFIMGQTDQDITYAQIAQSKQVTIQAFYMDETEITNSEYRQFVNWVRDSIAITDYLKDPNFYFKTKGNNANDPKYIDWKKVGNGSAIWSIKNKNLNKLQPMFYQGEDKLFNRNEIDVRLLKYSYATLDYAQAAKYRNDRSKKRSDFIFRDTVEVYPDTLVWLADFSYTQNDPMVQGYFSHMAFDEYPVVGVNWRQARAFCVWRTQLYEGYATSRKMSRLSRMPQELPTEAEFEYAARGGRVRTIYPWGGPYIRNAKGCLMANFKPGRGNYIDDGGTFTVNVRSYFPNDFGLYNMAGNVAEWTSSAYDEASSVFTHDLNPTYTYNARNGEDPAMKRKVVRGGSWKDIGYFLQNSVQAYEYQDSAKSYIGFRCVSHYPGRDIRSAR